MPEFPDAPPRASERSSGLGVAEECVPAAALHCLPTDAHWATVSLNWNRFIMSLMMRKSEENFAVGGDSPPASDGVAW
jgi:hypothetical protein